MAPRDEKSSEMGGVTRGAHDVPVKPDAITDHPAVVMSAAGMAKIVVPGGDFLLMAEYVRHGADLVLVGADGTRVLIHDYFASEAPPPLLNEAGATIDGALASKLAGPLAPGQYAQAAGTAGEPAIGKVQTQTGSVHVKHADGTTGELHKGDTVFQGDVLQTDQGGAVGMVFSDGTTMSLGEKGRLVLDELAYDPGAKTGDAHLTLVSGSFALVSGQIPKTTPDALQLKTPTMTVGIRGTGLAGNDSTVAMMAEKGGVAGEVSVTTPGGQTLTLNSVGAAAVIGAGGGLTQQQMSPLQVMQIAGNAGAALPNAANLLSNAFTQAMQQVQQQLQQQQTPPPPPPPPANDQQGQAPASPLQQLQALHEAQVQGAQQQIKLAQALVAQLEQKAVEVAVQTVVHQFEQAVADTAAADAAAVQQAKTDFLAVQADHASVIAHVNAAIAYANANDTYHANLELALANKVLDDHIVANNNDLTDHAQVVTNDASGHGAAALLVASALTDTVAYDAFGNIDADKTAQLIAINGGVAPETDANTQIGLAEAAINSRNTDNAAGWSDGTLINARVTADGTLATDTAILAGLKTTAETASTAAHTALLNLETPLVNAAAADAVLGVQTGALVDTLTNYLNAAKGYLTLVSVSLPTGWTALQAELAVAGYNPSGSLSFNSFDTTVATALKGELLAAGYDISGAGVTLNATDLAAVTAIEDALTVADGQVATDQLLAVWKDALTSNQGAFVIAADATKVADDALITAQAALDQAQQASVDAAIAYADKQGTVANDSHADGLAIGTEHAGEASWQSALDTQIANALTSAKSALTLATAAATNAATDAATALADAATNHFDVAGATTAKLAADGELTNATTADNSANAAVQTALGVLHSYGIDASGAAWTGAATSPVPSNLSQALTTDQTAVTSARQAALAVYNQAVAVAAQADQQLAVANQQDLAAIQALAQAQALNLQVTLQNAATVGAAQTNAATADSSAHTSASAASAAAVAAASSRDAIKAVIDALNAVAPPANVTGAALADYNTQKAALIATVQGYYTTAATAADSATGATAAAGADVGTADTAKTAADAAVDVTTAKAASATAASAASDAGAQANTASTAANTAAAQLALATNAKATLAQVAADASAAQSRADDVAAALSAKTDVHAIVNAATSPSSGSLITLQGTVQTEYNTLLSQLGSSSDTGTSTLYGMWNAANAAKLAAAANALKTSTAQAAATAANTAFNAIDTALTNALAAKLALSNALGAIPAQITAAETALTAVDTAYSAATTAQTNHTSTSTALAQAIQADQAAQQALSQATASQTTADTQSATFTKQMQTAQANIVTALNSAAQSVDKTATADASAAATAAAAAATADTAARTDATVSVSSTQTDANTAATQATTAGNALVDAVAQVQTGLSLAGSAALSTPAAVLTALSTVAADTTAFRNALLAYDTSATTANLTSVTSALATLNTDLAAAQSVVNTANATTATAGVAANELSRAEQAVVTAGNAYLQAVQSRNDAAAALTFAQNRNPVAEITYWKSVYDNAVATALNAKTAAAAALSTGSLAQASAHASSTDLNSYLGTSGLPQAASDPAGKAKVAATGADTTATSALGSVSDAATVHTIYGEKAATDAAYTAALSNFNFASALASGTLADANAAAAAAQAAVTQAGTAASASSVATQLAGLTTQAANTAIAQDNSVHAMGLQLATPVLVADSAFVNASATIIDVLANDFRAGIKDGTGTLIGHDHLVTGSTELAGYTLTVGTASHGTVSVVTTNGYEELRYTAAAGYTGKDSFSYTVTYANGSTVSSNSNVSVVVEGAAITVPASLSVLENATATFTLAVADVNANEVVSTAANAVVISGVPSGSILKSGSTTITVDGSGNFDLTAAQANAVITVIPPTDFSGQAVLTITATATHTVDAGAIASVDTSKTLTLTVTPVTQGATISAPTSVSGVENVPFTLTMNVTDGHPGETTLSGVTIGGFLAGSTVTVAGQTLTANASGIVALPSGDWVTGTPLTIGMPANFFGDRTLVINATAQNGTAAPVSVSQTVAVHVVATPLTAAQGTLAVAGSGQFQVADTATAINAATMATLESHGITNFALTSAGTLNLSGGAGSATLTGSSGSDTYVLPVSEAGTLTLIDTGGTNVLDVTAVPSNGFLGASQSGNDLKLQLTGAAGGGTMVVQGQFAGTGAGIDHITHANESHPSTRMIGLTGAATMTSAAIHAATITGTSADEIIVGTLGEATLISGGGEDQFFLGGGNQTVIGSSVIDTSHGNDRIYGGKANFALLPATDSVTVTAAAAATLTTGSFSNEKVIGNTSGDYVGMWVSNGTLTGQAYDQFDHIITGDSFSLATGTLSLTTAGLINVGVAAAWSNGTHTQWESWTVGTNSITPATGPITIGADTADTAISNITGLLTTTGTVTTATGVAAAWISGGTATVETFDLTTGGSLASFQINPGTETVGTGMGLIGLLGGTQNLVGLWSVTGGTHTGYLDGQVFTAAGTQVGTEFTIGHGALSGFKATALQDGGFAVVWTEGSGAGESLYTEVLNADGSIRDYSGAPLTTGSISSLQTARLTNGDYVVVWETGSGASAVMHGQIMGADGQPVGHSFQAAMPNAMGLNVAPIGGNGGFVLEWHDTSAGAMKSQHFDAMGTPVQTATVTGDGYTDTLFAMDSIVGGAGNDSLTGGANQTLSGGAGNNTLTGNAGGGTGVDYENAQAAVAVNLSTSVLSSGTITGVAAGTARNGDGGIDTLVNIASVRGSSYADVIQGGSNAALGDYTLDGGGGADILIGGAANTHFRIDLAGITSGGTVTGAGGPYFNSISFTDDSNSTGGTISAIGDAAFTSVTNVQTLDLDGNFIGGTVTLGAHAAAAGINQVWASGVTAGVTVDVSTNTNTETLVVGSGNNTLKGGTGVDTLVLQESESGHTITVSGATTTVTGGGFTDTITGGITQSLQFYDGTVTVAGNGATIIGGFGNDHLVVDASNTLVQAGSGNEFIQSTAGDHTFLFNGSQLSSADTIIGGTGHHNTLSLAGSSAFLADNAFTNVSGVDHLGLGFSLSSASITLGSAAVAAGIKIVDATATMAGSNVTVNASGDTAGVTFLAGAGTDTLLGGSGADVATILTTEANTTLMGSAGNLSASYTGGNLTLSNVETLSFSDGHSLSIAVRRADHPHRRIGRRRHQRVGRYQRGQRRRRQRHHPCGIGRRQHHQRRRRQRHRHLPGSRVQLHHRRRRPGRRGGERFLERLCHHPQRGGDAAVLRRQPVGDEHGWDRARDAHRRRHGDPGQHHHGRKSERQHDHGTARWRLSGDVGQPYRQRPGLLRPTLRRVGNSDGCRVPDQHHHCQRSDYSGGRRIE